jgi:rhodanese-related sulfurtransferase
MRATAGKETTTQAQEHREAAIPLQMGVEEADALRHNGDWEFLDVREPWELEICSLEEAKHIPMSELPGRHEELDRNRSLIIVCHHGVRSLRVVLWLRSCGFRRVVNLQGGLDAWARRIDPAMSTY